MKLLLRLSVLVAVIYALAGFYIVGGNEKAVVRRFGRLVLPLKSSGLHYDWPYPFTKIDRINFAAVRTVTIGGAMKSAMDNQLGSPTTSRALLTGDQNLLQVRAQVLYRPSEGEIKEYLFAQSSPEVRLADLAEAMLVELISHSGVDFAHVQGLAQLNERLTQRLRALAKSQGLGLEIEQAVIEQVEPPVRVKAEFLDVSNARAEQARNIQEARTWAEQKVSQADSDRRRTIDAAEADRRSRMAGAQGSADRFRKLVVQMHSEADRLGSEYSQVRKLAVQRMSWQTLTEIWPKVRKKTVVNADGPVDVSVFPKTP
jgi:membrane protease subunit HflK